LNITVQQLYRISGNPYQKTGIPPDILLPDLYSSLSFGEASAPYAVPPDKVEKKVYYSPLPLLPIAELEMLSRKRTEQEQIFSKIKALSDSLQTAMATNEVFKLSLDAFREYEKQDQRLQGALARLQTASAFKYNVLATHYDEALIKSDNVRREMITTLIKKIQEDIYIEEAYSILDDLINSLNK
jgi:carboxyl-terminal processing protease